MSFGVTEFTNDQLPGLTGMCLPGIPFHAFTSRDRAEKHREKAGEEETAVVERVDGKFLVAMIDREDRTFIYI